MWSRMRPRESGELLRGLAVHLQSHQKSGDLRFARAAFQQHAHGLMSFLRRKEPMPAAT